MITATIHGNISFDDRASDRRFLSELYAAPAGSRISVYLGDRHLVDLETVDHLRQYVDTLHLDLHGSVRATQSWMRALRDPSWAVV